MKEIFAKTDLANDRVWANVQAYFEKYLSDYEPMLVVHKSDFRLDDYLYMVEAKRKKESPYGIGNYAVWTCWNNKTQCLNYGHYDLETEQECESILKESYREGI